MNSEQINKLKNAYMSLYAKCNKMDIPTDEQSLLINKLTDELFEECLNNLKGEGYDTNNKENYKFRDELKLLVKDWEKEACDQNNSDINLPKNSLNKVKSTSKWYMFWKYFR